MMCSTRRQFRRAVAIPGQTGLRQEWRSLLWRERLGRENYVATVAARSRTSDTGSYAKTAGSQRMICGGFVAKAIFTEARL
jgi:hypothetical protein